MKEAIGRVLIYHESVNQVYLNLGLTNYGTLQRWIKEYRENGYNVFERESGRHAKEGKDLEGAACRGRSSVKGTDEKGNTVYMRDFSTTGVNQKWTTDVTEFHIAAGKLYLSPIMDMYNHEIISYNVSTNPTYFQVQDMLDKAFSKYNDLKGLIFHSDQGWQYQMYQYHKVLQDNGIIQSMSRKGNCLDNCVMENFFGRLKNEMFYGHEYEFSTLDELQAAIEEYIDYYNNRRIQVNLKGLTPCEARAQALESR